MNRRSSLGGYFRNRGADRRPVPAHAATELASAGWEAIKAKVQRKSRCRRAIPHRKKC